MLISGKENLFARIVNNLIVGSLTIFYYKKKEAVRKSHYEHTE